MSELELCRFAYEGKFEKLKEKIENDKSCLVVKDSVNESLFIQFALSLAIYISSLLYYLL